MHPRTRELLDYLETQRAILRAAFDAVPPDARDRTPAPGQWSPAAIVEHLAIVDGRIAQLLTTKIAEGRKNGVGPETSADPILPTLAVERVVDRTIRTEAPERLHPSGLDASAAWDALERSTVSLRDAVAACDGLALSTLTHPHPLLGPLSLYHWIAFAGAHEARHAAQIRETSTQRTQRTQRKRITLVSFVSFVLMASLSAQRSAGPVGIRVLSTRADRVSGGDVLVAIAAPASAKAPPIVLLNGRDISSSFHADHGSFVGLVTGLAIGRNQLKVTADPEGREQTLEVTNYPIHGPIISGPHQDPFVCQTDTFKLPDGTTLGAPADANCSAPTKIQYVYMPKDGKEFKPLANTRALPDDVATTTTLSGRSVPFVVRVETGTMNRGIYQNVVLHDPAHDPAPTPFTPPPAWNRRLIALHGTGCPGGWYRQGGVMGVNPLAGASIARLGEGYAIFTNTLNHPTNSCSPFLAGETTMMGKEHAIETFGVPDFTVSMGSSGGAYTSLQIADEFPGLFDGILINATFPDALSIALAGSDARLLAHYVEVTDPSALTDAQQIAVGGYSGLKAFADAANQSQRTDPVPGRIDRAGYNSAVWNAIVPANARYDPKTNPKGARPTVFDAARNIYGVDPKTGFARRPFDNVGVQYGLAALNAGVITTKQFLDLNEKIGGFDDDANYSASRSSGDAGAIRRA